MNLAHYPEQDLKRRVQTWAIKLKVNPREVRLQAMRSKWGSCTASGVITLSLDLLECEPPFQDYVIVHELLHLNYPTHGKIFKALLNAYVPYWREYEKPSSLG